MEEDFFSFYFCCCWFLFAAFTIVHCWTYQSASALLIGYSVLYLMQLGRVGVGGGLGVLGGVKWRSKGLLSLCFQTLKSKRLVSMSSLERVRDGVDGLISCWITRKKNSKSWAAKMPVKKKAVVCYHSGGGGQIVSMFCFLWKQQRGTCHSTSVHRTCALESVKHKYSGKIFFFFFLC